MTEHLVSLSDSDLRELAVALRSSRLKAPFTSVGIARIVPAAVAALLADELQELADQGFSEAQIARMLEILNRDRSRRLPLDSSVDLVTTGPTTPGTANRDTAVVVRELFANADQSVLVAGYAIHQGQRVFQALADRMQQRPDLCVRLYVNIHRGKGDTSASEELIRRFRHQFENDQWPRDRPFPEVFFDPRSLDPCADKRASLHAKCVVVDKCDVFVSSANFTEAAHERNLEIGLSIRSAELADQITRHFHSLVEHDVLQRVL